jgi:hypothetical protein
VNGIAVLSSSQADCDIFCIWPEGHGIVYLEGVFCYHLKGHTLKVVGSGREDSVDKEV